MTYATLDFLILQDVKNCFGDGSVSGGDRGWGCGGIALSVVPVGKLGKLGKLAGLTDEVGDAKKVVSVLDDVGDTADSYNDLKKIKAANPSQYPNTQIHHILEQRILKGSDDFSDYKNAINTEIPSTIISTSEHQKITTILRQKIPYGSNYNSLTKPQIKQIYKEAYEEAGRPDLYLQIEKYLD
jgi:hypothetical protein